MVARKYVKSMQTNKKGNKQVYVQKALWDTWQQSVQKQQGKD